MKESQVLVQVNRYYKNGYYLGYLVLSALLIQEHILKILNRIENTLKIEMKESKSKYPETSLEDYTFGMLIGDLRVYVNSKCLFQGGRYSEYDPKNKTRFCQFECCTSKIGGLDELVLLRNNISHSLITNKINVKTLECKITESFSKEKIQHILGILSNIGLELAQREANANYFVIWKQFHALQTETPVLNEHNRKIDKKDKLWEFNEF